MLILEDLDAKDTWTSEYFPVKAMHEPSDDSDYIAQLASECNEDPETFKKRILTDIEEDDRKDLLTYVDSETENSNLREDDAGIAGGADGIINLSYLEVEENCRRQLQRWKKEQDEHKEMNGATLGAQKAVLEKEIKEQDEKRDNWRKEFEKELLRLSAIQQEQEERLESDLKIKNEALEQELRNHQNKINKIETDLTIERKVFEEQKAIAKRCLEELQCNSAITIQKAFRAHRVYKMFAPILMQRKEDMKIKKELQRKMDMENKELEQKIKMKLEEKRRKDEEKKQQQEIEKTKIAEAKRKEIIEQELRQREYEKKKNEQKIRLEKAKLMKQEEKRKEEINCPIYSSCSPSEQEVNWAAKTAKRVEQKEERQQNHLQEIDVGNMVKSTEKNVNIKSISEMEPLEKTAKRIEENRESQEKQQQEIDAGNNIKIIEKNTESISDMDPKAKTSKKEEVNGEGQEKKTNDDERRPESILDVDSEEVNSTLEIDTGGSSMIHNESSKASQKGIESKTPSLVMTGGPVSSNKEPFYNTQSSVKHLEVEDMSRPAGNSHCQALNDGALSDQAEVKRLAWMKSCKPWTKILRENQKVVIKKTRQRKSSAAKQQPPLQEALILHNTPWQNLQQVTTVTLHDLPGCSLSTLSKCTKLKFLSLRRCGLTALDGLGSCKELQYVDVQENCISIINCEGLKNLRALLLSKNEITSIHGLEECENLMNLEVSFNQITRIAGLEALKNLQRLVLDHNQLISTKALERTPLLTYLDCSYNYLTELEGIQDCGLLQILKLQGNNLSEIPRLDNHVLIRELYLDDNNLTTLTDLSSYWLPLLQVFSVSQNSITQLSPFNTFISLEELDLSSNCLSELKLVSLWLEGCSNLRKLSICKNPFLQENKWRSTLHKTLPALRFLNDEEIKSEDNKFHTATPGSFMAFCQHQISSVSKLWHVVNSEEGVYLSLGKLKVYCNSLGEILRVSNVHRYAHEYGDTQVAEREDPEISRGRVSQLDLDRSQNGAHIISGPHEDKRTDTKQILLHQVPSVDEQSIVNAEQSNRGNRNESMKNQPQRSEISARKGTEECSKEVHAAVLIQSRWRGYVIRRDICYYTKLHEAASVIQSAWRQYHGRKISAIKNCTRPKTSEVKQQAATVIQAAWKGFFLRKRLAAALAAIDREELEDDFEEVNLEELTFDENVFEKGWSVDSAVFHSGAQHLFSKPERPKSYVPVEDREYSVPSFPQEAWVGSEGCALDRGHRYEKDSLASRSEKQDLSHVYSMKSNTDICFKSEKEEKISQEWGFKDASTAQLMLKRAQKMKSKQAKHKKMLDPAVRLALFKNSENKHIPVMPPKKAQAAKMEYFRAKDEELCQIKELDSEALARSRELTYQWLHTQCADINTTSSATSKGKRFLPELNHDVLNGRRVQLVTNSPLSKEVDDLDLLSIKSGSTLSQNREEKVRTQRSSGTSSGRNVFAPVKINSGPQRKERISFRDNPVHFSGGWGGGKKKGKAVK
ncbi:hypothetical protein GDO81_010412 [Engystomops pustulosus]|uniref:Leucine-rich repeat and IQ domain-containing protein 1 n=1 Tax=Engystomops pustulosus TaxID=76066 RepID=A0AAV7C0N3_ENGPU|nr:hypothetical protein GDO81_010412 [Engystomops pustulosus]